MKIFGYRFALLLICYLPQSTQAEIKGKVTNIEGNPIPRAWIYTPDGSISTYTDGDGSFLLNDVSPPAVLVIFHKHYEHREIECISGTSQPVQIILTPRQGLSEEITVTARAPRGDFSTVGAASTQIEPGEMTRSTSTLVEIVEAVPGIAENGQGGHLGVYSIRGVSRHRVRTAVGGVRLAGERRSGVSASFLDPFLMGPVELTRGPSVIRHGSGALGGVVEILPRMFEDWDLSIGYHSRGKESFLLGGWGEDGWSVGFARRSAGNATAPNGIELNTHFTQYSGLVSKSWNTGKREFQLFLIPALGDDIGKSSSDFPKRTTNYPLERHLLIGFSTNSRDRWKVEAFFHPHDLQTNVLEYEEQSTISTNSIDFGARTTKQLFFGSRYILHLGADYFARRGVDSEEIKSDEVLRSLENEQEHEMGLCASLSVQFYRAVLEGGGRFTWFRQDGNRHASVSDTAMSGFAGVSIPLKSGLDITGSVGSGLRFPTLSERFFSGTTGRGIVIGNPLLDSERSINTDVGLKLDSEKFFASGYFFYNRITDYIERIDLEADLYTFSNLTSGAIRGLEWETALAPGEGISLYFRGHMLSGDDDQRVPLSDIPVHRFALGFQRQTPRFLRYGAEWQFRGSKDEPGNGEQSIPSANLLSLFAGFAPIPSLRTSVRLANLLNELYLPTADKVAAFAPGRSVAISVNWLPD